MKKIKNIKKIVLVVAGVIVLYLVFSAFKTKSESKSDTKENSNGSGDGTQRAGFPLKYGSKNKYVKALQRWLNAKKAEGVANFGANLVIDGNFGDKTLSALRIIWNAVEGYPVREVNEVQYLANEIHLYETMN